MANVAQMFRTWNMRLLQLGQRNLKMQLERQSYIRLQGKFNENSDLVNILRSIFLLSHEKCTCNRGK